MQSATLQEITKEKGQAPYDKKSIKVVVICSDNVRSYKNDKGVEKKVLNVAVGDTTMAMKCIVYDEQKFSKFVPGNTLVMKHIIKKPDAIVITTSSKAFPVPKTTIPESVMRAGKAIIYPPAADMKPLDEALKSPLKTRVSIMGQIVQEEATQEVVVNHGKVKVKSIYIKDATTPKCRVSLWREAADAEIRPGDHVSITDVVLNVFRGETSFSTTTLTKLQKCEAPEKAMTVSVIGCCVEILEVSFLLSDDSDIAVPLDIVQETFSTDDDLENFILEKCETGLKLNIISKGSQIMRMAIV